MKKLKIIKKKIKKKRNRRMTQCDIHKLDLIIFVILNEN